MLTLPQQTALRKSLPCGAVVTTFGVVVSLCVLAEGWKSFATPGKSALGWNHGALDLFVWVACIVLAAVVTGILHTLRRVLPLGLFATAFGFFFVTHALHHLLAVSNPGYAATWLERLLTIAGATLAASAAASLPTSYRRLEDVLDRAARGGEYQRRFAALMQSTLEAVSLHRAVRDGSGAIVDFDFSYLNQKGEAMIGQTNAEINGKLLGEACPALLSNGGFDCYRRVVETGETELFEIAWPLPAEGPDGAKPFIRRQVVKFDDGVLVSCVDVTSERQITQILKRALAFTKAIVSSSSFSIVVMDLDGMICSINPAATYMLGYVESELMGKNVMTLHDPIEVVNRSRSLSEELGVTIQANSSVLRAKVQRGLEEDREWTYICRNGTRLPVQLRVNTIDDEDGNTIAYMASSYDLTDRKQTDRYIYHIAHHDPLTGLPGRTLLRERLEAAVAYGEQTQTVFAVLMIDLDHFKRVNDSLGHANGDIVLREIAHRLRSAVRKVDTVARSGGDEFVVLLNGLASLGEAEGVARKLIDAFSSPIQAGGHQIIITGSIGVSMFPESMNTDELLKHADIALHHTKSLGRNSIGVFTPELGEMMLDKLKIESSLREALERGEFFLVYQPQISLTDHRLIGVEALIRWRNAEAGLMMPNDFIPIAEETGLIVAIGAWALETACREIAALQLEIGRPISVAVNLSPTQVHEQHFQATVERALAMSHLAPSCLELEITERLLMRDSEEALQIIERIQALGVTTAIDDFGTGFSNMSYITRFKVDRLKIDQSFVSRCLSDANSLAVTTAIIALAHSLNMEVVAEGVETVEQAVMLRDLECDSAQGYLYATPLTIAEVTAFAREACNMGSPLQQDSVWMYPVGQSGDTR